jgi:homoserine O-acetyltransferase/O-succinyltransferase
MLKPKYHILKDFKFESGEFLPEMKLEYATQGVKETDKEGNITNALLYLHGWTGDYNSVENLKDVIGSRKALDTDKFYIISPTALGAPHSTSPSTSGIKSKFPEYSIKDLAAANYQLITYKLGIAHLRGIMGTSMGGFQALTLAVEYPDLMDFLILNGTAYRISNQMYGVYRLLIRIIKEDPAYKEGNYSENPVKALKKVSNLTYLWSLSSTYFQENFSSRNDFIELLDEMGEEASQWDANDIIWKTNAMLNYDLGGMLSFIKQPSLIIGNIQDQVVEPKTSLIPLHDGIKDSNLFIFDSPLGHYGCIKDIYMAKNAIKEFIDDIIQ